MKVSLSLIASCLVLLCGCDLLDKNPGLVKKEVAGLQSALSASDWGKVKGKLHSSFAWTDAAGKKHAGADAFIASLKATGGGSATLSTTKVTKVADGKYLVLTDASVGSQSWPLRLLWKVENGTWSLTEAKDLAARKGATKSVTGQIVEEVGQATDYAIGYTPLKQKKKTKDKINTINDTHNAKLEEALAE